MKDFLDLPTEIMSTRQLAKLLLKAYMLGVEDYGKDKLKGMSTTELNKFVTPKLMELIISKSNNKTKL